MVFKRLKLTIVLKDGHTEIISAQISDAPSLGVEGCLLESECQLHFLGLILQLVIAATVEFKFTSLFDIY